MLIRNIDFNGLRPIGSYDMKFFNASSDAVSPIRTTLSGSDRLASLDDYLGSVIEKASAAIPFLSDLDDMLMNGDLIPEDVLNDVLNKYSSFIDSTGYVNRLEAYDGTVTWYRNEAVEGAIFDAGYATQHTERWLDLATTASDNQTDFLEYLARCTTAARGGKLSPSTLLTLAQQSSSPGSVAAMTRLTLLGDAISDPDMLMTEISHIMEEEAHALSAGDIHASLISGSLTANYMPGFWDIVAPIGTALGAALFVCSGIVFKAVGVVLTVGAKIVSSLADAATNAAVNVTFNNESDDRLLDTRLVTSFDAPYPQFFNPEDFKGIGDFKALDLSSPFSKMVFTVEKSAESSYKHMMTMYVRSETNSFQNISESGAGLREVFTSYNYGGGVETPMWNTKVNLPIARVPRKMASIAGDFVYKTSDMWNEMRTSLVRWDGSENNSGNYDFNYSYTDNGTDVDDTLFRTYCGYAMSAISLLYLQWFNFKSIKWPIEDPASYAGYDYIKYDELTPSIVPTVGYARLSDKWCADLHPFKQFIAEMWQHSGSTSAGISWVLREWLKQITDNVPTPNSSVKWNNLTHYMSKTKEESASDNFDYDCYVLYDNAMNQMGITVAGYTWYGALARMAWLVNTQTTGGQPVLDDLVVTPSANDPCGLVYALFVYSENPYNPKLSWRVKPPAYTRQSVVNGILLSIAFMAVVVAAVVAVKVISSNAKAKRLRKRQEQLDKAKQDFARDPSGTNLRKLKRAQTKYNKAATAAGVNPLSYNSSEETSQDIEYADTERIYKAITGETL